MKTLRALIVPALTCLLLAAYAAPAADPAPVKIGALLAITGPAANLGAPEARTAEMLVGKMNAQGGLQGHQIVLLVKDTGASPEKAVSFAKQLIEEEKVLAIIGPSTSGETMKIKNLCEEAGTLLISCAAAESIVNPLARCVFKTPQKDSDAARRIFQQMQKMKIARIAVTSSNTGFGKGGKEQLEKLAPAYGITIALSDVYEKEATDLSSVVTKIKAAGVQAVVNWSIEPAQSILAKNMRQLGLTIPLFQSHGFGNIRYVQAAGAAAEGIVFPAGRLLVADRLPDGHPQKAVLQQYAREYRARFHEDASTFGGHAYDALLILDKAMATAGTDRAKLPAAIEGLRNLVGTAGVFNFSPTDHNGLGPDAFEMLTVKDGQFTPLGD